MAVLFEYGRQYSKDEFFRVLDENKSFITNFIIYEEVAMQGKLAAGNVVFRIKKLFNDISDIVNEEIERYLKDIKNKTIKIYQKEEYEGIEGYVFAYENGAFVLKDLIINRKNPKTQYL